MSVEKYNSRKLKIFFYLIGSFVFFGIVITYTFINITLKDFLIGMFPIFIVFIAFQVIELIVGLIKKNIKFDLKRGFLIILISLSNSAFLYCLWVSIKGLFYWILSPKVSNIGIEFIIILMTLIVGIILYLFKLKYKTIYGLIEVSIGVMIALSKIKEYWTVQPVSTDFIVGYVTASIYLIVRGCDNLHQGFKSGSKDPIAKRVHDFIYC